MASSALMSMASYQDVTVINTDEAILKRMCDDENKI